MSLLAHLLLWWAVATLVMGGVLVLVVAVQGVGQRLRRHQVPGALPVPAERARSAA